MDYNRIAIRVARRLVGEVEMIESPDLEWQRFVESLSPEDKAKAGGLFLCRLDGGLFQGGGGDGRQPSRHRRQAKLPFLRARGYVRTPVVLLAIWLPQ